MNDYVLTIALLGTLIILISKLLIWSILDFIYKGK